MPHRHADSSVSKRASLVHVLVLVHGAVFVLLFLFRKRRARAIVSTAVVFPVLLSAQLPTAIVTLQRLHSLDHIHSQSFVQFTRHSDREMFQDTYFARCVPPTGLREASLIVATSAAR